MEPSPLSDGDAHHTRIRIRQRFRLQWSRRLSATETGPPPIAPRRQRRCFNGAVASQRRRLEARHAARLRLPASMEPSPLSDGDKLREEAHKALVTRLQWSRRLSATETALEGGDRGAAEAGFNGAVASQRRRPAVGVV